MMISSGHLTVSGSAAQHLLQGPFTAVENANVPSSFSTPAAIAFVRIVRTIKQVFGYTAKKNGFCPVTIL